MCLSYSRDFHGYINCHWNFFVLRRRALMGNIYYTLHTPPRKWSSSQMLGNTVVLLIVYDIQLTDAELCIYSRVYIMVVHVDVALRRRQSWYQGEQ